MINIRLNYLVHISCWFHNFLFYIQYIEIRFLHQYDLTLMVVGWVLMAVYWESLEAHIILHADWEDNRTEGATVGLGLAEHRRCVTKSVREALELNTRGNCVESLLFANFLCPVLEHFFFHKDTAEENETTAKVAQRVLYFIDSTVLNLAWFNYWTVLSLCCHNDKECSR